jgi:hypothetical protein
VTCGLSPYQYSNLSRVKYDTSRYHLDELDRVLPTIPPAQVFNFQPGTEEPLLPVWAHSDGCIFQLYAAFDAFACAVAHRFGLSRPERASFKALTGDRGVGKQVPDQLAVSESVQAIIDSDEFGDLEDLRNRAAHRAVVGQRVRAGSYSGIRVLFDHGLVQGPEVEVPPVLHRLIDWAHGPLWWLWDMGETWRQSHETSALGSRMDRHA